MSDTNHTPGPWKVGSAFIGPLLVLNKDGKHLAHVGHEDFATCAANAHLIAAAPDMLEALRETVLQLQYLADKFGETGTGAQVLARVNAAISKATER